ncbi:unnamed protein product [Rhizophagus irregularis]|uniref:Uncharacterized protein n=1 Tax=Rhizophagus irregularis TaxID=588596 RepID=A0A915YQW5_9GLOM|nr:unnamed protein product [Rhizophagus irregularis]CAB5309786.1 unnamed protein product [Rhizophagus irregularis]
MANRNQGRGRGRGQSRNKNSSKGHSKSKNTDLIEVVDKTINDETLNDKRKRSIASSSDDSSDDKKNQKETSSQLPLLERKNDGNQTDDSNKSSHVSANEHDSTLLQTSDSRILTKILEVVMQNQKDLKFLSTKVMGLESDNKNFHNELSEIKDAIGLSDESLKAVSSNKKTHGWIDVYISYIAEDLLLDYKYPTKE